MSAIPQSNGMNGYSSAHPNSGTSSAAVTTPARNAIDAERAKSSLTFKEVVAPGLTVEVELRRILAGPIQSQYQKVEILETYFGKVRSTSSIKLLHSWFEFFSFGLPNSDF